MDEKKLAKVFEVKKTQHHFEDKIKICEYLDGNVYMAVHTIDRLQGELEKCPKLLKNTSETEDKGSEDWQVVQRIQEQQLHGGLLCY